MGSAGYEEARQWPLLPSRTLTAGDPIPDIDPRRLWLDWNCIVTTFIPNCVDTLSRAEEDNHIHDPILEEFNFIPDLDRKPEEEWSPHEKRRVRKFSKRWGI